MEGTIVVSISSGRPLMRQTSSSTRRPPSSRQQATSTAVIYLLAVHELVEGKVHGKARYLAQAEAMAIIAALNRFAPAALHGADSVGSRAFGPPRLPVSTFVKAPPLQIETFWNSVRYRSVGHGERAE